jgi:peptidoglycan/xylan/chitin deacetylase (PgdA/CDA1 family)
MFVRNIRVLTSMGILALVIAWSTLGSAPKHVQKYSSPHPQNLAAVTLQPQIDTNSSNVAPAAPVAEPSPLQEPLPMPVALPPPPSLSQWKADVEPLAIAPGEIPVITRIPTDKPVVFLGIDDGLVKSPEAKNWLIAHHLPFTLFLEDDLVKNDYDYFRDLQDAGMSIQDHTITHADLATLSFEQQKAEICGAADRFETAFGNRPTLFRPPYGSFDNITKQAAADCGMKALIMWHAKANGGSIQFQDGNTHFLPGDIVLMHFRPEFLQDMQAFVDQAAKDNLQVGRLEDWLL